MKKVLIALLILVIGSVAFANGQQEEGVDAVSNPTEAIITGAADTVEALGPNGAWIVIAEQDVNVDSDVVISGEVYEEEGAEAPRRKLALYAQDSDRNVTARYTLTVPKLIVRHVNTRIQGGIVKGDVYVEAENFNMVDATIDGNLYFKSEALKSTYTMDEKSTVTGTTAVKSL
jgi:hypothetical protein